MHILITGGAGFIGCNFVRFMIKKYPDADITVLDKLTYAGRRENLADVMDKITFIHGDIARKEDINQVGRCDVIFNFAAETHVDRSIQDSEIFIKTDVLGTYYLLEFARKSATEKFIQISTDEVYGSTNAGYFREDDPFNPSSPYSASKAAGDLLSRAYYTTYGLPVVITRSSNNFGEYQYPEKLIPFFVCNAIENKPLPLYGKGTNIRDWIYVMDNCEAIEYIHQKGVNGEAYNIGGGNERTNLEIANFIVDTLKKPRSLINFVEDRPGHDFRYALKCDKLQALGWQPRFDFKDSLYRTIHWYTENEWWWKPLRKVI